VARSKGKKPKAKRPRPPRREAAKPATEARGAAGKQPARLPIVGIGASAGGLEALEQFLRQVPPHPNCAFVLVQHLDPLHRGMLVELLQRTTPLQVAEATDGVRVEPEHLYVIPPGKDMSLLHGTLHLLPQVTNRGRVLPIDFFFRSLAQDQGERAIGVILSGMGSDGTLGLRAIKEAAGATFVQSPESAKFDGMPRSAIDAGLADVVAPVEELPGRIFSYRDHAAFMSGATAGRQLDDAGAIDKICLVLREHSGNDFTLYKRSTIVRRIERRMGLHQIDAFPAYLRLLRENPRELELLFEELLIGVTSFFRDPAEWERLHLEVLPTLVATRAVGGVIRAWVPGCSTGEEAYSLAMVLREALEPIKSLRSIAIQIFATDLDRNAIERARIGLYPENIAADVSPARLRRFFVHEEHGYRVSKDIRETVVFAPQNVIRDPPFTKVDVLSCRNLLIYLSGDVQKKLIPLFHYCLNPGGALFLGTAETVGSFTNLFTPLDSRTRIYRRLDQSPVTLPVELGFAFGRDTTMREEREEHPVTARPVSPNVQVLVDRLIVQRYAPLGILCNTKGDVLYVSGRAGKFLEPAIGKPNLSVFAMAREGLRYELSTAFAKALRSDRPFTMNGIKVGTNGGMQVANLTVEKLSEPKELQGTVFVLISEVAPAIAVQPTKTRRPPSARASELSEELQKSREEVQTIREEMQTSQEELKSANEELQSTNEELQSTNEELTTSKEEMQSLNEELQTVNHELQAKVDELSRSNNDMKNLLNSTDIATLFLDTELRVRRFTTATSKIIKLIPADVGRPITDLASDLDYTDLAEDAREVLRTLIYKERQSSARDGRAFTVRILPYRTLENVIDGVVVTFTDASAARALELAAREQTSQLKQMAESLPNLVWGARGDGAFDYISKQWVDYTGVPDAEQARWGWLEQVHAADRDRVREEWRAAVKTGGSFDSEFRIRSYTGAYRWFKTRGTAIRDTHGGIVKWYGTSTEIDELKRAEDRLGDVLETISDAMLELDSKLVVVSVNRMAERLTGKPTKELVGRPLLELLPSARALEQAFRKPPAEGDLQVAGERHHIRIHRDREDGFRVFVHVEDHA
jgi:two-component system CheB/CheR fusion protein